MCMMHVIKSFLTSFLLLVSNFQRSLSALQGRQLGGITLTMLKLSSRASDFPSSNEPPWPLNAGLQPRVHGCLRSRRQ